MPHSKPKENLSLNMQHRSQAIPDRPLPAFATVDAFYFGQQGAQCFVQILAGAISLQASRGNDRVP
ncbi:MAG TPA: hypothetical protein DEF45_20230 [Rhodopirellula sp.]|nr:hypothetical protein [Rhodopirellula sp.]